MKVEVNENKQVQERDFPKLMEAKIDGEIVLFINNSCGTVIKSVKYPIGSYHEDWVIQSFKDFNGSITLSNE